MLRHAVLDLCSFGVRVNLRHAVLATLAYYDVFDMPLTPLETWRCLVNPARLEKVSHGVGTITLGAVAAELDHLVISERITCRDGVYSMAASRADIAALRITREKIAARKWRTMLGIARWFQAVPYLRGMFVSGSLAFTTTDEESDFDMLTIFASGRLYTGRVFLACAASLFGARRTRYDRTAPDKFCFNHYLSEQGLAIPYESMVNAQMYARLVPMISQDDAWERFCRANAWINKFVYHANDHRVFIRRSVAPSRMMRAVARAGEFMLNSRCGDWIEKILKRYQQKRIQENPMTHEPGGRTVFTDDQLEFHPHSAEQSIIAGYVKGIRALGIVPYIEETDSGLLPATHT